MKNILNIKVNSKCDCTCHENIDNGTNRILVRYERENPINPKIVVNSEEHDLEFVNGVAIYELQLPGANEEQKSIEFKFIDDDYDGHKFFIGCNQWRGNLAFYTAKLVRVSTYSFRIDMVQIVDMSTMKVGSGLTISDNGEIEIEEKEVESITAKKNENDQVTLIGINYTDGTSSINQCVYDNDGNLVLFGDIEINWS